MLDVADSANIKKSAAKKHDLQNDAPWFDINCKKIKQEIRLLGKKIKMEPKNTTLKFELAKQKRILKHLTKKKKLSYKHNILEKMKLSKKDSKRFWKLLDKLDHKPNETIFKNNISQERWTAYFKSIFYNPLNNRDLPENPTDEGPLDFEISDEELEICAYILRNGKSPGLDRISYEMISCVMQVKPQVIKKIFNAILKTPTAIQKWHTSMISPIHKKGSKLDPDNYRGISLISCFAKFFLTILNHRLTKFVIDR